MKIQQDVRGGVDALRQDQKLAPPLNSSFHSMVEQQGHKMKGTELEKLLRDIDLAGQRLNQSRHFQDLAKFKTLVKRFVKEAIDYGLNLKQSKSWSGYGERRTLRLVETIDEKLVEITENFRQDEQHSLTLLEQIGEIKGLLINLYS